MSFPSSHKTIFVLDHTLSAPSGVKLDLESISKPKSSSHASQCHSTINIPLLPVIKSYWTCIVEAITEYSRIVWDIFPSNRLIRFITVDNSVTELNAWTGDDQNLQSLMNIFLPVGPPKTGIKADLVKGLKVALEALTKPTEVQREKRSSLADNATKVLNKGRIILMTRIDSEKEVINMKERTQQMLTQSNKAAASTDSLMPINHAEFIIVNFCKENQVEIMANEVSTEFSPFLSCEVFNISCGLSLAPRLCCLVLRNYDLASTTVTGIPMKEEQNASSSANYDVELFHPAAAHAAILKGIPSETAHLKTIREGTDYETVTLKWCTPRSNANLELQHCSSAYRVTSVDVNSRPSSCLTNFLLSGRWVMLEMPRKSGSKVISHMLACHGGEIYIHTLNISRSILEDPPSISEGCGGRVTDYRIPDFGDLMRNNILAPHPTGMVEEGEDVSLPLEAARDVLARHTKVWPITLSTTYLCNLGPTVEPLSKLFIREKLSQNDILECKNVVFTLMNMEARGESLPITNVGQRNKTNKKEEQYKWLWVELEQYLTAHQYSKGHEQVLECLLECQNKSLNGKDNLDDKVDIDQALMEIDNLNGFTDKDMPDLHFGHSEVNNGDKKRKSGKNITVPIGKKTKVSLFAMLEEKAESKQSLRPDFRGNRENDFKLYANFCKDKEKDDSKPSKAKHSN